VQTDRQTDNASHLILDAEIKLQLEVLDHEVLQAFLDDAGQHDAKREAFEQLATQQDLDGLPLSEQALGAINMLFPRLQISANFVFSAIFLFGFFPRNRQQMIFFSLCRQPWGSPIRGFAT